VVAAIDSILASSYTNVEAIVIDDGSEDNTPGVIAKYTDPRIRYFRTKNGGMSAARNHGLDQARGEYIAFLDSDDAWMPWKLAAQIELLRRHSDVGLVWTDMSAVERSGEVVATRYLRTYYYGAYDQVPIEKVMTKAGTLRDLTSAAPVELLNCAYYIGDVFREMFLGSLVHPSTAVVRRERVRRAGRFNFAVTGPGGEDYHFYYCVSEHGPVALLDVPTVFYRIDDPHALSKNGLAQARGNLNVLAYWVARNRPALPEQTVRARMAGAYEWLGTEELYGGEPRAARAHLWKSLRLAPDVTVARRILLSLFPKPIIPTLRKIKHLVKRNSTHVLLWFVMISQAR
jgi:glycosyltransferase involved in cell wall biosynthesis